MHAATLAAPTPTAKVISADDLCRFMRSGDTVACAAWEKRLDRVLRHDAAGGQLEVQAGTPWAALAGIPAAGLPAGTVGESVARNRPGPDGEPLVAHVIALTFATPDGQLRRASRERSAELFRLAVGGHGAFGPYYSITLDLRSLEQARRAAVPPVAMTLPAAAETGARHAVELLLPPERAQAAVARLREAVAERRFSLTRLEARPAKAETETMLRWACREFVVLDVEIAARPTLGASVAAAQLCARLIDVSIEAGGSFMPASLPRATRAQAEACYPMLGEFLAEKRRLDPAERVRTPWVLEAVRVWRGERCRVRFG